MGAPPGMASAPGMTSQSPGGMHNSQFQPPPNMPNINFNAPVIRLGVDQGGGGKPSTPADRLTSGQGRQEGRGSNAEPLGRNNRLGLGAQRDDGGGGPRNLDRERQAVRESMMAMQPPTREEVARTIFIGGLTEGTPSDAEIESILRCAGKLRRWTRAKDADDKACKFGFAEYEDVESLEAANEIFVDVDVPMFKNGVVIKEESGETKTKKLLVVVDEQSKNYINEWKGRRREDDDARHFRIDGCKEDLRQSLASLANQGAFMANGMNGEQNGDVDGDVSMGEANGEKAGENAEIVTIPVTLEDELADIPQEMRAGVAEEIKAFRDRSNRRDLERMRREEELEQAEKQRAGRVNRLASPPPSGAPSGPASASNGIPVGPRDRNTGVQGAPSGPKGYRGAQLPNDYVNGVSFVGANGATNGITLNREDEDAEESDDELERRRQERIDAEHEKQYLDAERRWLNRERTRGAAQEREKVREEAEKRENEREREAILKRLREWDDDVEARRDAEEYYNDKHNWLRKRAAYKDREQREDERDRMMEEREKGETRRKEAEARGMAEDFMDQMGSELEARAAEQPTATAAGAGAGAGFKLSLGSAAARTKAAQAEKTQTAPRRGMADVEGLLEDEEDAAASGLKRPELKPLVDTTTTPTTAQGADMTDSERAAARQSLAADVPTSTAELFSYPVKFNYLTPSILTEQVRPFVEKKVVEFLGVQEDLLVDTVVEGLRERKEARVLVGELEDALEGEAEVLVRKVWRLVVFVTEGESRGL